MLMFIPTPNLNIHSFNKSWNQFNEWLLIKNIKKEKEKQSSMRTENQCKNKLHKEAKTNSIIKKNGHQVIQAMPMVELMH